MNIQQPWWQHSSFYHIYPLGFCGAPEHNDFTTPAVPRLEEVADTAAHIRSLGCDALYLGPLFESSSHGYDTVDHYHVDRRLGDNRILRLVVQQLHNSGLRVILDGVFNHVGRDHFAFYDLRRQGEASPYRHWFKEVDFSGNNRFDDGFTYRAWEGHEELPELNLELPELREHLFGAVGQMIEDFDIDGLRLDVAYALPPEFIGELARYTADHKEEFFLLGEMIHGDYGQFAAETGLHSLTNYETYKALWSSHNDGNYFELAHSLARHFGPEGISRNLPLYNFVDNHDVDRIADRLIEPGHLFPVYALLFTIPGIPSVYYASEFGIKGRKAVHSDAPLRPPWRQVTPQQPEPADFIRELAEVRRRSPALKAGSYRQLFVDHHQLAFERRFGEERVVAAFNSDGAETRIELALLADSESSEKHTAVDMFQSGKVLPIKAGVLEITLPPYGSAIFRLTE